MGKPVASLHLKMHKKANRSHFLEAFRTGGSLSAWPDFKERYYGAATLLPLKLLSGTTKSIDFGMHPHICTSKQKLRFVHLYWRIHISTHIAVDSSAWWPGGRMTANPFCREKRVQIKGHQVQLPRLDSPICTHRPRLSGIESRALHQGAQQQIGFREHFAYGGIFWSYIKATSCQKHMALHKCLETLSLNFWRQKQATAAMLCYASGCKQQEPQINKANPVHNPCAVSNSLLQSRVGKLKHGEAECWGRGELTLSSPDATLKASSTKHPTAMRTALDECISFHTVSLSTYHKGTNKEQIQELIRLSV